MGNTIATIEETKLNGGSARETRRLHFVSAPHEAQSWIDLAQILLADGHERLAVRVLGPGMQPVVRALKNALEPAVVVYERKEESRDESAVLLLTDDDEVLDAALLDYLDIEAITLAAPVSARYWKNLPLYLISIPKAGTHLLFRLAEALGYEAGGYSPDLPRGGSWYYLLHSNAHTTAREFFVDALSSAPHGMRAHPFTRSPVLFNYRNPLDILVSEARYFHIDGISPLSAWLASLSEEERINRLLDDPWLLGTIRERVGAFAPWLECGNVIPVSFEELVGSAGGGSDQALLALVWSLQLKLHVPGDPAEIKEALSVRSGATFRAGKIGSHGEALSPDAIRRFKALPQDFMEVFGYSADGNGTFPPARAAAFRHRPLVLGKANPDDVPFLVDTDFFGHNIIAYNKKYFAAPMSAGPCDLSKLAEEELQRLPSADDKDTLRSRLAVENTLRSGVFVEVAKEKLPEMIDAIQPAIEARLDRSGIFDEIVQARLPEIIDAIQPAIQARLDQERVGSVHDLGPLLGYRMWRRSDAYLAVPWRIGSVDPRDVTLGQKRGVLASRTGFRLRLKVIWEWIRWAYWDGAKI